MTKNEVGKGVFYLYIQLISSMIFGYIFYILLARITSAEIIGTFSLLVSISEIFASIALIGMPDSIQRFLGKSLLQSNLRNAKVYVRVSLIFLSASIVTSTVVIIFVRQWLSSFFGLGFNLIIVIDLLIASYAIFAVLNSMVISSLRTKALALIVIIVSIAKVTLSISLVLMGFGVIGLTLGYTFFAQALSSILLSIVVVRSLTKPAELKAQTPEQSTQVVTFKVASKDLLTGGIVVWIPVLITTLGIDLGTLVLYNSYGSFQSGIYFIALAISNAINAIVYAVFTISLPVLSSMKEGRKDFTSQTIRLSSIVVLPLACSLIFYSKDILQLIGTAYVGATTSLQILLLSILPIIILSGLETLVYSYGQYRYTLAINLALNIPRTILYFVLVPIFGMMGVAMSYTIGSVIGFAVSMIVAKRIRMTIFWKGIALMFFLPISISFALSTLNVNYIVGILGTITVSYVVCMKLHLLTKSDVSYLIGLMPYQISNALIRILERFEKITDRFFR